MGREMRRLGLGYDLILASPAARVTETLNELAQGYGGATHDRAGRAHLSRLARNLAGTDPRQPRTRPKPAALAGHNPGLRVLALRPRPRRAGCAS